MDAPVLTVQDAEEIERMLLQSPNASIRILKSPYGDNAIAIQSDAVGEIQAPNLAQALAMFRDHLLHVAPEVAEVEEVIEPDKGEDA